MRVEKRDGSSVRKILIGMIVNTSVVSHIAAIWDGELFPSKWANLVGGWAVRYYNKYDKAPKRQIEGMYEAWARKTDDDDTVKMVERFLGALSDEYATAKELNAEYIIDLARQYFSRCKFASMAERITGCVDSDDIDGAREVWQTFNEPQIGTGSGIDVLLDDAAIRKAFESHAEPIITMPKALGRFFGDSLCRGGFVSFMGPEKRGKTWWLMDLAWRAMLQRKRVAFFEVGDMNQDEIMLRWMIRACKRPLKKCSIEYPTQIEHIRGDLTATIDAETREYSNRLQWKEAIAQRDKILKHRIKTKESYLKLLCTPNDTMTIDGIQSQLREWERRGWVPDICVVDYADILAARTGIKDEREGINHIWKGLRRISQSGSQPLVITATQANAASYDVATMSKKHFSNDKRKFAHVTAMIGINQTPEEKEYGLQRLNMLANRASRFTEGRCVHVAGCLDIGNPAILSTF